MFWVEVVAAGLGVAVLPILWHRTRILSVSRTLVTEEFLRKALSFRRRFVEYFPTGLVEPARADVHIGFGHAVIGADTSTLSAPDTGGEWNKLGVVAALGEAA